MDKRNGVLFDENFIGTLRSEFCHLESDPQLGRRLFFDNSGGSLRLRRSIDAKYAAEEYPDCPERSHERALMLRGIVEDGTRDILETVFGSADGALITELTASQAMFNMVGTVMENVPGTNAVVSVMEHPSAFDAVEYYCRKTGRELRVIPADTSTGGIDPDAAAALVDGGTCLVSVMAASNVTGAINDIKAIAERVRKKNPDVYVISDAVQHMPHCAVDFDGLGIDGMNFAPYKFFGVRGCGFACVSPRLAHLPHRKLIKKPAETFALGTPTPGNFSAMTAVIDYVCDIARHFGVSGTRRELYVEGMRRIHLHERALLCRMLDGLRDIDGVTVCADGGEPDGRDLIAAINIDGYTPVECVAEYERRGVVVCDRMNTSMYAKRIVEALGLTGAVRVSPLHCHTVGDIDEFLEVTREIAARR